jgi:pyruvate dehydrogenase E2 component (dihydrolipoamide acetyltransferase)
MAQIIEMPKLSDTMTVGTVVKWHKSIGEAVVNGDILAEIETDKATMELENFDDGVLLDVLVPEGSEAPIGSSLAIVGEVGEDISSLLTTAEQNKKEVSPAQPESSAEDNVQPEGSTAENGPLPAKDPLEITAPSKKVGRILASPLAKKIALEKNIDLSTIQGSGPGGRITRKDLETESHTEDKPTSPKLTTALPVAQTILEENIVPVSKMRSIIASRLLESKNTIPHFYLQKEINAKPLSHARTAINKTLKERNPSEEAPKVSLNDLILKACAETIKWHPAINSSWMGDSIKFHGEINLAFGVAVEDGLLTPVIKNAERLSLLEVSQEAKSLIKKSRSKKLSPAEMSDSTFTITNLGMFGIDFFSGIINPPNAAILSVGASTKKAVVDEGGNVIPGETMMLGLSCDHRVIDGAIAATFLQALAACLENPSSMLV